MAAFCWIDKKANQSEKKCIFLWKSKEILDEELWAILEVLDLAKKTANIENIIIKISRDS